MPILGFPWLALAQCEQRKRRTASLQGAPFDADVRRRTPTERAPLVVAAAVDYRLFRTGMFNASAWIRFRSKMRQGHGNLRRLQPRGVVGIHVGNHYDPVPIDDV